MAKNSYNDDAIKVLIGILVVASLIAIFLVKWAIIGVVLLIVCIVKAYKTHKNKATVKNVVKDSYKTLPAKPVEVITKKELKQALKIFDIDIYDNLFEPKIKPRGQKYYEENRIKSVEHNGNKWSCKVEGTQEYETSITFDNENISKTNCTCPYYQRDQKNCKHIYALLIKAKCENNIPIIMQAITDYSNSLTKIVNKETEYVSNNISNISKNTNDIYNPLKDENRIKLKDIMICTMIMSEIDKCIRKN